MIGYPNFIMDPKELDKVFNDVSGSPPTPWHSQISLLGKGPKLGPGGWLQAP